MGRSRDPRDLYRLKAGRFLPDVEQSRARSLVPQMHQKSRVLAMYRVPSATGVSSSAVAATAKVSQ
jgi:hypothetical protein